MSLDTYTNLQAEIVDWMARPDLAAKAPTFIALFEAAIRPKFIALDDTITAVFNMVAGQQTSSLPGTAERLLALAYTSGSMPKLKQVGAGEALRGDVSGAPCGFSLEGAGTVRWDRIPDSAYEVAASYKGGFAALSDATATNWLLESYPNLYLYGALSHAKSYMQDAQSIEVDKQLAPAMDDFLREMNRRKLVQGTPSFYRRFL